MKTDRVSLFHVSTLLVSQLLFVQLPSSLEAAEEIIRPTDTACLLIAVEDAGSTFENLPAMHKDVQVMQSKLQESGYGNIKSYVVTSEKAKRLPRVRIDRKSVIGWLEDLVKTGKGIIVFYFSGHGINIKGKNYIVLEGADVDRPDETMISFSEIYAILQRAKASKKIVLFDCCQNELEGYKPQIQFISKGLAKGIKDVPAGFIVVTSCDEGQTSMTNTVDGSTWTQNFVRTNMLEDVRVTDWKSLVARCREDGGHTPQWAVNPPEQTVTATYSSHDVAWQEKIQAIQHTQEEHARKQNALEQQNMILQQQNRSLELQLVQQQNRTYSPSTYHGDGGRGSMSQKSYSTKSYSPSRQIPVKVNVGRSGGSVNAGGFRIGW